MSNAQEDQRKREKQEMKVLHYYNEYLGSNKILIFEKILFLGIENICNNLFLRFQMENNKQFRRDIHNDDLIYEKNELFYDSYTTGQVCFDEIPDTNDTNYQSETK